MNKKKLRIFLLLLLTAIGSILAVAQSKDDLLEMLKSGMFDHMSAADIRSKLQQLGISEADAIQMAKEKGVDLTKYLGPGGTIDTTKIKQQLQGQGGQTTPTTGMQQLTPPTVIAPESLNTQQLPPTELERILKPDTTKVPKGEFNLDYFGYNTFKNIPTAFEPNTVGSVDPGYLIGPGDDVLLSVWGQAEFQYELEVDREGRIFIPNVGQVFVVGIPLRDLQGKLTNQLSKYYSGLASNPPTVFIDVTVTKLRPLRIFVMGELTQPGGYTISSYATVFNALYAVGGPTQKGSLRNVKVIRENKVVATVDLYDYLLKGDQSSDVRLQNNDVVFIPPRGKTAAVRGEILRPAIYELKDNENLTELIQFAGGFLPTSYLQNGQIDRVRPFDQRATGTEDRMVVDVDLTAALKKSSKDIPIYDADVVRVFPILDEMRNYVTLDTGGVWRPGTYQLEDAPTLRKLIAAAKGLQPKTFLPVGHIIRYHDDRLTREILPFNLGKVLEGTEPDITLMPKDSVLVYSSEVSEIINRYVIITGEVKKPGRYELEDNLTLADLLIEAGGYTEEAYLLTCEISRVLPGGMTGDTLSIILHPKLPEDLSALRAASLDTNHVQPLVGSDGFKLQQRDEILIRPNPDYKVQQNVIIEGDITFPGYYALETRGERLSDIIDRAGGPTKTTFLKGAEFYRHNRKLNVDFSEAYYSKDKLHNVLMQDSDRIVIPSSPHTVSVIGEVNNPGLLSFVQGQSVGDYIDRAGGITDSSNYAVYTKPTGESQRVNFGFLRSNPDVLEGSIISVTKIPPPPVTNGPSFDLSSTIKDTFAILTSAATIAFIVYQVKK